MAATPRNPRRESTGLALPATVLVSLMIVISACGSDSGDDTATEAGPTSASETDDDAPAEAPSGEGSDSDSDSGTDSDSTSGSDSSTADDGQSDGTGEDTDQAEAGAEASSSTVSPSSDDADTTIDTTDILVDEPDKTTPTAPPTTVSGDSGDPIVDQMIGMTEEEAIALARSVGRAVRVADRDGEQFMLTQDYDPERVNLSVNDNRVTAVRLG